MKRSHSCLAIFCTILAMTSSLTTPVCANSAQSMWTGTTSTGAIVTDEACPIVVESELLTFDIQEFPLQHYSKADEFFSYSGRVTAEYSFYNPADYTVEATLVFPFGAVPDYGYLYDFDTDENIWNTDTEKYDICVNGEPVSKELRHTFIFWGDQFNLEEDIVKLYESYMEDSFYSPELPVTKYTYFASDVDIETYDAATAAFVLSADATKTKVFMENQCGGATLDEGVRLDTWVELDEQFSVYVMGEPLAQPLDWKFYDNGGCENEISGKMNLVSTEKITLKDFVLSKYDERYGVLDYDWYNAVVTSMKYFEWTNGAIHSTEVNLDVSGQLMRWYQYDITLEPGERIVNTVTAPMYPSFDTNYEPPIYEYIYLLSPAQTWAEFGNLDIVVNTPYYMTKSGPEGFERNGYGYEVHLDGLPEGELTFTLCAEADPAAPSYADPIMGIMAGVGLVTVIAVVVVIVRRKRKRTKFVQSAVNR